MIELLQMWALVEVLGFACLPLTVTVFHNLPDRGWAFSKALGVALLAFGVWFPLMCFQTLPFSQLFIAGVLLILLAGSVIGFLRTRQTISKVIHSNSGYLAACEVIFLGMVFLLGWIRSYGPDIRNFEMFMDEGFIASIMRSPHLPPADMWMSGYALNYYYYAHFTVGMLAKLLGQSPSIAFNTGICALFGLTAVNLFGVTCNIVGWAKHVRRAARTPGNAESVARPDTVHPRLLGAVPYGLLTMVMGLVLGNLAATQQWWREHGDATQFDWFSPTRVVDKTINEFPAFSFLLSCFHAHVLALAFTIVAIALALNLFLERGDEEDGGSRGLRVFGRGWRLPFTLGATALILGALFTMNGWDFPTYVGLAIICIALQQWLAHNAHFDVGLILDVFTAGAALIALSLLLYVPFYLHFISPALGLGIVDANNRSQPGDEVLIYGTFAFIFISLLVISAIKPGLFRRSSPAIVAATRPAWLNREALSIGLIGLVGLLVLLLMRNSGTFVLAGLITAFGVMLVLSRLRDRSLAFVLLLGTVAFGLVAVCEVIFLRDVFADSDPRMNTVFKFYFQCWALLSITSGAGLFFILEGLRPAAAVDAVQRWVQRGSQAAWLVVLCVLLLAGAVYPLVGTYARTNHYAQRTNSLDGLQYMQQYSPGDYYAIRWLNSHVEGDPVILESVGPDYSNYARISAFTGLPTLMGWVGHEYQWRVNWFNHGLNMADFARRTGDIDTIYTDPHPDVVMSLLARYQVEYVYVGPLEQAKYPTADLHRFGAFLQVVYTAGDVTIYQVTGQGH
ncbi:MAG: DUF2298 domain-containing protein [Chloroflexota bacterium]|nr:DUF2298 domain-containing protein [Chloroflexota bacterium]